MVVVMRVGTFVENGCAVGEEGVGGKVSECERRDLGRGVCMDDDCSDAPPQTLGARHSTALHELGGVKRDVAPSSRAVGQDLPLRSKILLAKMNGSDDVMSMVYLCISLIGRSSQHEADTVVEDRLAKDSITIWVALVAATSPTSADSTLR